MAERLAQAGGYNRFGEPNYRAVWGWNRLTPIGGKWEDNGAVEIRMEPKYPQVNRWHIERWCAPEVYGSPAEWELTTREEGVQALGPYPERGEYEHVMAIETPTGGFLQLTPTIVEHVARRIERVRAGWNPKAERKRLYSREEKNDENYVEWCMEQMNDTATWSYTPHTYLPAKLKEKIA